MGYPGFVCPILQAAEGVPKVYFNNLQELIGHYRKNNQGLATHLRYSVNKMMPPCIKPKLLQDLESAKETESMYFSCSTCNDCFIYFKILKTCAAISLQLVGLSVLTE